MGADVSKHPVEKCIQWENLLESSQWMLPLVTSLRGAQWKLLGSIQWKLSLKGFH
jgi:hypothetical protein